MKYTPRTLEKHETVDIQFMDSLKNLASQMLINAYSDLWRTGREPEIKMNKDHAKMWIYENENNGLFSFNWCCNILQQPTKKIRDGMTSNRPTKFNNKKCMN
jgi:hypothetical protein